MIKLGDSGWWYSESGRRAFDARKLASYTGVRMPIILIQTASFVTPAPPTSVIEILTSVGLVLFAGAGFVATFVFYRWSIRQRRPKLEAMQVLVQKSGVAKDRFPLQIHLANPGQVPIAVTKPRVRSSLTGDLLTEASALTANWSQGKSPYLNLMQASGFGKLDFTLVCREEALEGTRMQVEEGQMWPPKRIRVAIPNEIGGRSCGVVWHFERESEDKEAVYYEFLTVRRRLRALLRTW